MHRESRAGSENRVINIRQLQILATRSKEKENLNKICAQRTSLAAVAETKIGHPKHY